MNGCSQTQWGPGWRTVQDGAQDAVRHDGSHQHLRRSDWAQSLGPIVADCLRPRASCPLHARCSLMFTDHANCRLSSSEPFQRACPLSTAKDIFAFLKRRAFSHSRAITNRSEIRRKRAKHLLLVRFSSSFFLLHPSSSGMSGWSASLLSSCFTTLTFQVCFLLSDSAGYITGVDLLVDGGLCQYAAADSPASCTPQSNACSHPLPCCGAVVLC